MQDARSAYLETLVLTAAPQKLRLMLIDGCVRFARQAQEAHATGNAEQYSICLDRAREIVTELIAGIRPDRLPANDTARSLYAFVFKSFAEAQLLKDLAKIDDALKVLEEERQTWLAGCEQLPESPVDEEQGMYREQEVIAGTTGIPSAPASSSFSLDA
jgi:flagellar protein FliS